MGVEESREVIVIYDGQCRFCQAALGWIQKKVQVSAIAFQDGQLEQFGLTVEQCSKEVFVLTGEETYAGAGAIAHLLHLRGNTKASNIIKVSGPLGRSGYRWIAGHRSSVLVQILTKFFERH